ncbi:MAG: hypothetical protein QXF61_10775 [Nitrososphaeria archaeon]
MQSVVFNIAGKLRLGVKAEKLIYSRIIRRIVVEYGYFKSQESFDETETDISVTIGPIRNIPNNYVKIDGKYFIGEDWIYTFDKYKIAKWRVYISGFESNNSKLCIEPNLFASDLIPPIILTPLIGLQLFRNGLSLVHAGGVSRDNKAILFVGFGGSGKTSLVLRALEIGFKLLGDDHVILDKGKVLPFPTAISLFKYNVPTKSIWAKNWNLELELKNWIQKITLGYIYPVTKAEIKNTNLISKDSKLSKVILLEPSIVEHPIVEEITREELVHSWIQNIFMDSIYFHKYLYAFSYGYDSEFIQRYLENLKEILQENLGGSRQFIRVIYPKGEVKGLFDYISGVLEND